MLRQARDLFALPAGNKKKASEASAKKSSKQAKIVAKKSKSKVSKQIENDDSNNTVQRKSAAFAPTDSMLQDRLEANINHRKGQNHSSSSGGSSSGYLSQAVGFQSNENANDETATDHVAFGTRNGPAGDKVASRQNGSYHLQQAHQSDLALNSTLDGMIDARLQQQPNGRHHFQHLRAPTMMPMMIDDDDDDDDDAGQLAVEDLDDEADDENLDVRQMLASHRERLWDSKRDQLEHQQHNAHYGGLIDGLPESLTDDKLSQPTYGQVRRSLAQAQKLNSTMPHHHHQHANSDEDDANDHGFNRKSFQRSEAGVATFGRPHQQHYQAASYLYNGQQSLDHHLHSSRQQYLNRSATGPHHLHHQQQHNTAAIYYQPNLIDSEHRHKQRQERHHKTYERPCYLQTSSSFLYHQPYSIKQIAPRRHHYQLSAANKPVPPLPPPSHQRSSTSFANTTNGQLNSTRHLHQQQGAGVKMMQTSGSRQHLTTSAEQQQQHNHHHHHHHHSSSASSSPHSRRNNLKQGAHTGSSQLSNAKQNLRSVPNRSTPTPTHLTRPNGPTAGQMLPAGGLSGELAPPMKCCGKMAKFLLFIANSLFWAGGIALGAWGILGLVDDHKYNLSQLLVFEPSTRMSLFQLLSWSFITLGCATILVGFCGCSAMFKNSRWILGLYIFLILAIFALDLATGLLAIIFQERLVANVRLRLVNKLRTEYGIQASFTAAIDYIQTRYECCGLDGHLDYDQSLWRLQRLGGFEATVARTCCHLRNTFDDQAHVNPRPVNESMCQSTDVRFHQSYRYRRGCLDDLERLIRHKIWTFTIGCGAVGAVILLSMVFATCFCRSIPNTGGSRKSSAATATGSRVYNQQQAAYLETTNPKKTRHSSYRCFGSSATTASSSTALPKLSELIGLLANYQPLRASR